MCFGGGSQPSQPAQAPPPPKDTPTPAGTAANQRFQQIRAGLSDGTGGTTIDSGVATKGATVLGETR